jgi:hypothetical protein
MAKTSPCGAAAGTELEVPILDPGVEGDDRVAVELMRRLSPKGTRLPRRNLYRRMRANRAPISPPQSTTAER